MAMVPRAAILFMWWTRSLRSWSSVRSSTISTEPIPVPFAEQTSELFL